MHQPRRTFVQLFLTFMIAVVGASAQPYGYVANMSGNQVVVINRATNTPIAWIRVPGAPSSLAVTPDGAHLYVTCQDTNTLTVVTLATNSILGSTTVGLNPVSVAISPNGAFAYVANQGSNNVSIINTSTRTVLATVP